MEIKQKDALQRWLLSMARSGVVFFYRADSIAAYLFLTFRLFFWACAFVALLQNLLFFRDRLRGFSLLDLYRSQRFCIKVLSDSVSVFLEFEIIFKSVKYCDSTVTGEL